MLRSCKVVSIDNLVTGNNIAVTNLLLVSLVFPSFFLPYWPIESQLSS